MRRLAIATFGLFALWPCPGLSIAAQAPPVVPPPEPEQFPLPQPVPPPPPAAPLYVPYPVYVPVPPRLDTRNIWSLYAPDQYGRMRPRVVLSPYGSYYLYNGEPYGWTTITPRFILPRTSD